MIILAFIMLYLTVGIGLCVPLTAIFNDTDMIVGSILLWPLVLVCWFLKTIKVFLVNL